MKKMAKSGNASFVFANCKHGISTTLKQIERMPEVETVTPVTGRFDLVIKLRTNNPERAFTTLEKIRGINGITSTQTALSFESLTNTSNSSRHRSEWDDEQPGYALLKVKGKFQNILQRIKTIPSFIEAHIIPGEFDILASFRNATPDELAETASERLTRIDGVTSCETLVPWSPSTTQ